MVKVQSIKGKSIKGKSRQGPILSWVPVAGPDGRIHMEMRWQVGSTRQQDRRHSAA